MEGALVFLANAAGKIASADERDGIDARAQHEQLERSASHSDTGLKTASRSRSPAAFSSATLNPDSHDVEAGRAGMAGANEAPLNNGGILTLATEARSSGPLGPAPKVPAYTNKPPTTKETYSIPAAERYFQDRPQASGILADIDYIGPHGILDTQEAEYLVNAFFSTMHPFFPYVPKFLQDANVLGKYPILLCAILCISSRYHSLSGYRENQSKHIEVHDRLWLYVQRLISQTVWAEASTRSIGTVFAFLLFTEWNPRAIHWRWSDYANRAEDLAESREVEPIVTMTEPAGLGAMRRSNRMAWMLIGSAVRLAQDTGFMEHSSTTFLATHLAEINSVMNMKRRSMLGHSLAEVNLDTPDVTEEDMELREDSEYKVLSISDRESSDIDDENVLGFTQQQKAQIELLQIMSVGHESLYGYKAQLGALRQRQNLAVLSIMSPMIDAWGRKYKQYLVPLSPKFNRKFTSDTLLDPSSKAGQLLAQNLRNESFIFEFNYTKLYIYSLALSSSPETRQFHRNGKLSLKLDEISKSAKYIEQAFFAANEILAVAHRVHKLRMLRFMPVRWVTRIVRAVAFIVKCYLTITAHKSTEEPLDPQITHTGDFDSTILSLSLISIDEIVQAIHSAAVTLRDCSPDELHLCTRYLNVLLYLYSEMKTSTKKSPHNGSDTFRSEPPYKNQPSSEQQPLHTLGDESLPDHNSALHEIAEQSVAGDSEIMDWFMNNKTVGLDFVGPWTELLEQQIGFQQFNFDEEVMFD